MRVIALEGPSGAGKTTVCCAIESILSSQRVAFLPDYVKFAGGPDMVPAVIQGNLSRSIENLLFFLELDRRRTTSLVSKRPRFDLAIMDRSVHSLLAHDFAMSKIGGIDYFSEACKRASEYAGLVEPEAVIYLDASYALIRDRHKDNQGIRSMIFMDSWYNSEFRNYFIPRLRWEGEVAQYTINPDQPVEDLARQVIRLIGIEV